MEENMTWKWSEIYANWYFQAWTGKIKKDSGLNTTLKALDGEWKTTWNDLGPGMA
jgi:hypothetical protein